MKKKKYEWRHRVINGEKENGLFIDGEHFDWEVDEKSLEKAFSIKDPDIVRAIQKDIENHYLDSLSEFVGRKITKKDIDKAEKTGWI